MKFFKGCLIVLAIIAVLLLAGGAFIYVNRDKIVNSVTDAISDAALADNAQVIEQIDQAAAQATTFPEFVTAVKALDLPSDIIYLAAESEASTAAAADLDEGRTIILQRVEWTDRTFKVFNGIGAAALSTEKGEIAAIILERTGPWDYMKDYVVYIEQTTPTDPTPTPTPAE